MAKRSSACVKTTPKHLQIGAPTSVLSQKACIRDWSLITGREATKREGGGVHVKFYPYEKGGGKSFSHAKGGAQKVLG